MIVFFNFLLIFILFMMLLNFSNKLILFIFLEMLFIMILNFFSNLFCNEKFFFFLFFFLMVFMVLDSCLGLSILSGSMRNSTSFSFFFNIF